MTDRMRAIVSQAETKDISAAKECAKGQTHDESGGGGEEEREREADRHSTITAATAAGDREQQQQQQPSLSDAVHAMRSLCLCVCALHVLHVTHDDDCVMIFVVSPPSLLLSLLTCSPLS